MSLLRHSVLFVSCLTPCCRYRPVCTVQHSFQVHKNLTNYAVSFNLRCSSCQLLRPCLVSAIHDARSDVTQLCSTMASLESRVTRALDIGTGYVIMSHDPLQPHDRNCVACIFYTSACKDRCRYI